MEAESRVQKMGAYGEESKELQSDGHSERLLEGAFALWQRDEFCDVMLEAEGQQFPAHKAVLASASRYCRVQLQIRGHRVPGTLRLQGVTAQGLSRVLRFVYTGTLALTQATVEETARAAQALLLQDAIELCIAYLEGSLSMETCPGVLAVATRLHLAELQNTALAYLSAQCPALLANQEVLQDLGKEALLQLLRSGELRGLSESELLRCVLCWLQQRPERLVHTRELLAQVRLALVAPAMLLTELGSFPPLRADPHCAALLQEALSYHSRPHQQTGMQGPAATLRWATPCLLALGGRTTGNQVCREVWVTSEVCMDWRKLGEMNAPLYNHSSIVFNNFLFVLGGQQKFDPSGSQPSNEVHRYDPRTEQWLQVASMLTCRTRFHADVLAGAIVAVAGGTQLGHLTASVELYSFGENRWDPGPPLPTAMVDHAGTSHRGILYIAGGFCQGETLDSLYTLLPRLRCWVANRPLTFSRCDHGMAALQDRIFCVGGRTLKGQEWVHVKEMESYSPAADQWTVVRASPLECCQFSLTASSALLYITGGGSLHSHHKTQEVLAYPSQAREWEKVGETPLPLVDHCTCALALSGQTLCRLQSEDMPDYTAWRRVLLAKSMQP